MVVVVVSTENLRSLARRAENKSTINFAAKGPVGSSYDLQVPDGGWSGPPWWRW